MMKTRKISGKPIILKMQISGRHRLAAEQDFYRFRITVNQSRDFVCAFIYAGIIIPRLEIRES